MKKTVTIILISICLQGWSQKPILTTDNFTVEGSIKQSQKFSLQDLMGLSITKIDSVIITNHLLEKKSVLKNMRGVLLKDVLGKLSIDQADPKLLSEYYFVCIAADNYKVVFSWNEIFNNETGRHTMIITAHDGKNGTLMNDRIALLSPYDEATGRRYVKGLQKIIVRRVSE
ncbi:MAG: hypothetical protein JWP81_1391 [Ferruginibacter sp.]|nr:hypothetical protein [Ferruginibacter sp.]